MGDGGEFTVRLSARYAADQDLVDDLARVADLLGTTAITREQYAEQGLYHPGTLHRRLGGWVAACARAGLSAGRPDLGRTDDEWLGNVLNVWQRVGRQPSFGDMRGTGFSPEGYAKRYGSWGAALLRFQDWIQAQGETDDLSNDAFEPGGSQRTGRSPNLRLRFDVLQRDRFTCQGCGRSPSTTPGLVLHVDHIKAYSKGGETVAANLQALCSDCNFGKSNRH